MLSSAPPRRSLVPRVLLSLFFFLAIASAIAVDRIWLRLPILAEYPPAFSPVYLARTGLICLGAVCFVTSVAPATASINWQRLWDHWGQISYPVGVGSLSFRVVPRRTVLTVLGMELLCLGFVMLFLRNPGLFSWLALEWHPVEVFSAAFLFCSSGVFARTALRLHSGGKETRGLSVWIAGAFALLFFLVAMEEVSWFQGVLKIPTPAAFQGNSQGELNLHNFVTSDAENAYYFSTFLLLVLGPFLVHEAGWFRGSPVIRRFVPSRVLVAVAAPMVAFNYDMWNGVLTQLTFFLSVWILLYYLRASWTSTPGRQIFSSVLALVLFCQGVFLLNGSHFKRLWDITEYKELLIPLACCFYAAEVWRQVSKPLPCDDRDADLALVLQPG